MLYVLPSKRIGHKLWMLPIYIYVFQDRIESVCISSFERIRMLCGKLTIIIIIGKMIFFFFFCKR